MWQKLKFTLLILYGILTMSEGSSHYCLWGLCSTSEYCCGYNQCCSESNNLHYVASIVGKVAVVLAVLVTLIVNIKYIYSWISRRRSSRSNTLLLGQESNQESTVRETDAESAHIPTRYIDQ